MTKKICNDRKGYDKIFHLCFSFGLGSVLAGVFSFVPFSPWLAALCVLLLTLAVGIGKEIRDSRKPGEHFCVWDLVADFIGALAATPVAYFANYFTE